MIDVIIPTYNAKKTICQTLLSLYEQTISDKIKIYIVDDNSSYDYNDIFNDFSDLLNIKILKLNENMGPGYARYYGIKNSNSKYILFIDSDDILYNCYSLEHLYNSIENSNSDIVISNFIEDCVNEKKNYKNDTIWMHGKIYRRKFLEKNNINFNFSRANEDFGFNKLCILLNPKINYLNETTYIWKYNPNSITRRNNHEYIFTGINGYAFNTYWAVSEALKRYCDKSKCAIELFSSLYEIYFYYLKFIKINEILSRKILEWCFDIEKIYKKYEDRICHTDRIKESNRIFIKVSNNVFLRDIVYENFSFEKFLLEIEKEGNKND